MIRDGKTSGFTLLEVLVVTLVIGILVGLAAPALLIARKKANDRYCKNNLLRIGQGLAQYELRFSGFLPQDPEPTNGQWYERVAEESAFYDPETNYYSWQQILDKVMEADNGHGTVYTIVPDYTIDGKLVNMRGQHKIFTDIVFGYGAGIYIGTYGVFRTRSFPNGSTTTGPLNRAQVISEGVFLKDIPVMVDGTRANSDELWTKRFRQVNKFTGTSTQLPHVSVTGLFEHTAGAGADQGKTFYNIDFRHGRRANVLYLDWHIGEFERPVDNAIERAKPDSPVMKMKRIWDTMFPLYQ